MVGVQTKSNIIHVMTPLCLKLIIGKQDWKVDLNRYDETGSTGLS